jgi:hypothetical protein
MSSRGSSTQNWASVCSIATIGVATVGFGLPESCLIASQGFSRPDLDFWLVARSGSVFSVVSDRIPKLHYAKYGVWFRRRDDWLRDAARRFARIVLYRLQSLCLTWFGVLMRRRDKRYRDALRLFFLVVSRHKCLPVAHVRKNWILCRRCFDTRCDAWRPFLSIVSYDFPGSCSLPMVSWIGVATLGVALLVSCLVVSLGSCIMSRPRNDTRRSASVC